ncbi:unnamed protein product [Malus baccata var. baccata]
MSGPSDRRFDLNFCEEATMPPQDNIWRPSFLSPTGPLIRNVDQLQESDGQILLDHQRFVGLFQRHLLPSSSGVVPCTEAPNDQPSVPPPSRVLPSTKAPNDHPLVPPLSRALPTAETSPEQPL